MLSSLLPCCCCYPHHTVFNSFPLFSGTKVTQKPGKFFRTGWGATVDGKLGWLVMEAVPVFVFPTAFWFSTSPPDYKAISVPAAILLFLWMAHYVHRAFVYTYFAPSISPSNITIVTMAIIFNIANGFVNGVAAAKIVYDRMLGIQFWVGVVVFLCGAFINIDSDYKLFRLRREAKVGEKIQRYFIPCGFIFEYISGANYFGELIEWTG
ncbi:3-oxo-5-alpha-steroid 4-dehydrogenase 1 [Physocladia obscura]|uniref:3-oxo-5-alpha-steroid 4-dehydrogenase 1 n=1 Tax=Physocladia obscura TaxID=109957 RepID=A0AAD5T2X0_9FUNG|nr:3-oxo-5-alpha-steroid 4-dehydrogenase 1 [Physocladia obscura]